MKKKTLIIVSIIILITLIAVILFFVNKNNSQNSTENESNAQGSTQNSPNHQSNTLATDTPVVSTPTPKSAQSMTKQEKSIFNSNFDMYMGSNVKSSQVKSLLATVKNSNEHTSIRKIELFINGEETLDSSKINQSSTYSVSFEYDENGLICKAIVKEN